MSKQSFVILSTTEGRVYLTHTATVRLIENFFKKFEISFFAESPFDLQKNIKIALVQPS
jgi:hypothetical protein